MKNTVSVVETSSYNETDMYNAVDRHFTAYAFQNRLTPKTKVLLKPNLLLKRAPELGTTTHPQLVKAVVKWLEKQGVENIVIADSPGGPYTKAALQGIYKVSGLAAIAEETTAILNDSFEFSRVEHPKALICKEFDIINPVLDADVIINLPKLKTHGMMQLSAGVKNLFGMVPGLEKPELHFRFPKQADFAQMLVDLSTLIKPDFTIIDAVVSMEGDGPASGTLRETGLTFAAENIYALDVAVCDYVGMSVNTTYTVKTAINQGLSPSSVKEIEYFSDGYPQPAKNYKAPTSRELDFSDKYPKILSKPVNFLMQKVFVAKPVVKNKECIGCKKCEESCAPKAIIVTDKKAKIKYKNCIKCFCCHEMCPVKAIYIKRTFVVSHF